VPKDVLRSVISPAAKLVFAAIAAEMYDRKTVEMTHAEIGACCHVAPRHVKRSIKALVAKGLVEQRRLSAGRVYQYRTPKR
jgi:DNA-binding MarR family transcriptional regulator